MIERVITGGQTGADQAGWRAAKAARIATGGWMPRGYWTEAGERPEFADLYGAAEIKAVDLVDTIKLRTWINARESEATLWFGDPSTPGGKATHNACQQFGRPFLTVRQPDLITPGFVAGRVRDRPYRVLNVAGNRESKAPGIGEWVERYLAEVFRLLREG